MQVVETTHAGVSSQTCGCSDCKDGGGGSQRPHGARLKVIVNQSVWVGADAAGGGACSHLTLLEPLEITLEDRQERETSLPHLLPIKPDEAVVQKTKALHPPVQERPRRSVSGAEAYADDTVGVFFSILYSCASDDSSVFPVQLGNIPRSYNEMT